MHLIDRLVGMIVTLDAMKTRNYLYLLGALCLLMPGCKSEPRKDAELITERFLNECRDFSGDRHRITRPMVSAGQMIDEYYPALDVGIVLFETYSDGQTFVNSVGDFAITGSSEEGNRVTVHVDYTPFNDTRHKTMQLFFDRDSLKLGKTEAKIQGSLGLLNYTDNLYYKYYSAYFDKFDIEDDNQAYRIYHDVFYKHIHSNAYMEVHLEITKSVLLSKDLHTSSGYFIVKNSTDFEFDALRAKFTYYATNRRSEATRKNVVSESYYAIHDRIKPHGNTCVNWRKANEPGKAYTVRLDYDDPCIKRCAVRLTAAELGIPEPDIPDSEL